MSSLHFSLGLSQCLDEQSPRVIQDVLITTQPGRTPSSPEMPGPPSVRMLMLLLLLFAIAVVAIAGIIYTLERVRGTTASLSAAALPLISVVWFQIQGRSFLVTCSVAILLYVVAVVCYLNRSHIIESVRR